MATNELIKKILFSIDIKKAVHNNSNNADKKDIFILNNLNLDDYELVFLDIYYLKNYKRNYIVLSVRTKSKNADSILLMDFNTFKERIVLNNVPEIDDENAKALYDQFIELLKCKNTDTALEIKVVPKLSLFKNNLFDIDKNISTPYQIKIEHSNDQFNVYIKFKSYDYVQKALYLLEKKFFYTNNYQNIKI